jgi:hypothetical protein
MEERKLKSTIAELEMKLAAAQRAATFASPPSPKKPSLWSFATAAALDPEKRANLTTVAKPFTFSSDLRAKARNSTSPPSSPTAPKS